MILEKYRPNNLSEVVGQKAFVKKVEDWLENRKKGKALMVYGPAGTGKTMIPKLIAKRRGMSVFEINASDRRGASHLKEILNSASKDSSLLSKRMIIIDDVDSMGRSDSGGIAEIAKVIRKSAFPMIITAKNAYDPKIRTLRSYCTLLKITRIRKDMIRSYITRIAENEGLDISLDVLKEISEKSDGDIRSAVNDLHSASHDVSSVGNREVEVDIFETVRTIFKSQDFLKVKKSIQECEKNLDEIIWWVEQNIANEYEDPKEIALAFEYLSKADMFRVKIFKTRNYRLTNYMVSMVAAVSLAKRTAYRKFVSYKPPDRLIMLGRSKAKRMEMDQVYQDLAAKLHCSKRKVKEQMPFLEIILGDGDGETGIGV